MEWYDEFLDTTEPTSFIDQYMLVKDAQQWHYLHYENTIAEIVDYIGEEEEDPTTETINYFEGIRPEVSRVYTSIRKHFEKEEEYEQCAKCVEIEKKVRYDFLKIQTAYEKKERHTR